MSIPWCIQLYRITLKQHQRMFTAINRTTYRCRFCENSVFAFKKKKQCEKSSRQYSMYDYFNSVYCQRKHVSMNLLSEILSAKKMFYLSNGRMFISCIYTLLSYVLVIFCTDTFFPPMYACTILSTYLYCRYINILLLTDLWLLISRI